MGDHLKLVSLFILILYSILTSANPELEKIAKILVYNNENPSRFDAYIGKKTDKELIYIYNIMAREYALSPKTNYVSFSLFIEYLYKNLDKSLSSQLVKDIYYLTSDKITKNLSTTTKFLNNNYITFFSGILSEHSLNEIKNEKLYDYVKEVGNIRKILRNVSQDKRFDIFVNILKYLRLFGDSDAAGKVYAAFSKDFRNNKNFCNAQIEPLILKIKKGLLDKNYNYGFWKKSPCKDLAVYFLARYHYKSLSILDKNDTSTRAFLSLSQYRQSGKMAKLREVVKILVKQLNAITRMRDIRRMYYLEELLLSSIYLKDRPSFEKYKDEILQTRKLYYGESFLDDKLNVWIKVGISLFQGRTVKNLAVQINELRRSGFYFNQDLDELSRFIKKQK